MSTANVHLNLPVSGNGSIDIKIGIDSLESLATRDRVFILDVINHLASFVSVASPIPALEMPEPVAAPPEPEVLRGLTGSRP